MSTITTICRCCQRALVFPEGASVLECSACFTINARPQAEGTALAVLQRATEQRLRCDFHNAENSYQHVLLDYPTEHEALWGLALCRYGVQYVDDPRTGKRMPVVHTVRRRPMRLDSDYLQACDLAPEEVRAQYETEAAYIDNAMLKIRELAKACPPFDVFICHKTTKPDSDEYTEDYNRAFKLYHMLDKQGYRSFFAPMEMENVSAGSDYEAGIYHALDTAKVMLVVCSDAAYLTSPWVRSEWSRFLEMADETETKCVLPLLYGGMAPTRLPRDFWVRNLQCITMGELDSAEKLMNTVRRYAGVPQTAAPVPAPVPVQQPAPAPMPVQQPAPAPMPVQQPAPAPVPPMVQQFAARPQTQLPSTQCRACGHKLVFLSGETAVICPTCRTRNVRAGREEQDQQHIAAHRASAEEIAGRSLPGGAQQARAVLDALHMNAAKPYAALKQEKLTELTQVLRAVLRQKAASQLARAAAAATAAAVAPESDFQTESVSGGCRITRYTGTAAQLRIPATINGRKVLEIGESAFAACTTLTEVIIPEGVTLIGMYAFDGCTTLTHVSIPASVKRIHSGAFNECRSLKHVELPEGLAYLSDNVFNECNNLTDVNIPASAAEVRWNPFPDCPALRTIRIAPGNPNYCMRDGILLSREMKLQCYPAGLPDAEFAVPAYVKGISHYAFQGCRNLRRLYVPASVTEFDPYAFGAEPGFTLLVHLNSPAHLYAVSNKLRFEVVDAKPQATAPKEHPASARTSYSPFRTRPTDGGCVITRYTGTMAELHIPSEIQGMRVVAIAGEEVAQPDGTRKLVGAFENCTCLVSVTIPDSVSKIDHSAFAWCKNLKHIVIPDSVTFIGNSVFFDCRSLTNIDLPEYIQRIGKTAFAYCNELTTIRIPPHVTSIGHFAFILCQSLTSVSIPSSVKSIEEFAFSDCTSLKDINIPNTVSSIGSNAFRGCDKLPFLTKLKLKRMGAM